MLKEVTVIFVALLAVSWTYPEDESIETELKALDVPSFSNQEALETESLEGAESANPQWGRRGWGGSGGRGWGDRWRGGNRGRWGGGGGRRRGWGWGK